MKRTNTTTILQVLIICMVLLGFTQNSNAQSFKERMKATKAKLEEAANGGKSKKKPAKEEPKEEVINELNGWHKSNEGKIIFYEKIFYYNKHSSASDSEYGMVKERILGNDKPLGFRAYIGKPLSAICNDCKNFEIKYTIGDQSITTTQLREEQAAQYSRMSSALNFFDRKNYSLGISLIAAKGEYTDMYTLQEDAFRILLSKAKDKLKMGATVNLRVEVFAMNNDNVIQTEALATGELPIKVTEAANNLQNVNCRCGKAGLQDDKIEKDAASAFEFQFDDVKKVHHVVLLERDWAMNYDNSYPTKQIVAKGMNANFVYTNSQGITMMVKRYVYYDKTPSGFSDKIKVGKHVFFLPVSPTCAN